MFNDGNSNQITVEHTSRRAYGLPVVICRLIDNPTRGYIATLGPDFRGFGEDDCPSSYDATCLTWFGPRERYPNAEDALLGTTMRA